MDSIWTKTARRSSFEALKGDAKTDVLIVGGGISGILCAFMLERAGVDYLLVEAKEICGGVTENTTAKITSQHGLIYGKLLREFGTERARLALQAQQEALEMYRTLCRKFPCGFQERDNFVYSKDDPEKLLREMLALEELGFRADFHQTLPLPFAVAGAIRFSRQAQFHPLEFLCSLAEGLRICENTKVLELRPDGAVTTGGKIRAEKTVIATHFPILNKHGAYFLKQYQYRSYVLALENAGNVNGMYVDEAEGGLSFRNYGKYLLLGGGGHRTGKQGGAWRELRAAARRYYPGSRETARWATQDCMTLDGLAYIGQYSPRTPNLYVATGYNKWGMTSAMTAALLITDLVQGKENPYEAVFSPSRTVLRPQLVSNVFHATAGLLTPTVPRCPHMGCALKYNPQERSWDCSCHGSRFSESGEVLNNPATDDKKMKKPRA